MKYFDEFITEEEIKNIELYEQLYSEEMCFLDEKTILKLLKYQEL